MSPNESPGVQSPDVESLLKQMTLRKPSGQLDSAISDLVANDKVKVRSVPGGRRFGWKAILVTATVAVLAGIWLGSFFMFNCEEDGSAISAASDLNSPGTGLLTPVAFNVQAFNLLHGHSERAEFANCGRCHQLAGQDATLAEVFKGWFYGDAQFFEAHAGGIGDCSECHVAAVVEKSEFGKNNQPGFEKLANCSECHKVDADRFDGFKNDWRTALGISKG